MNISLKNESKITKIFNPNKNFLFFKSKRNIYVNRRKR